MNTSKLKTFAQDARRRLMDQVAVQLEAALNMEGAAAAENKRAINELKQAIYETSREAVIERVAYIWFNRFCALRFMDANNYTLIRTVSPAEGFTQPEILAQAKQGIIPDELLELKDGKMLKQRVMDLLSGTLPSRDGQGEAYRLLLVAVCNYYHSVMPYMFEEIDDYTELLLPSDLLSEDSVLGKTVKAMTPEACEEVEVIGWLYQFYISEKKDEVFASKKKVSAENIPAATQLFTPNWIVRYLVENSLGRLWMLNNPDSRLRDRMDYYIEPAQQEEDFLRVGSPEELRICDPAVGSGHMLVYAFDLLHAIYEERGYQPSTIPDLILQNNLYGIEIDERAGALAAFALTMKARQKARRFFRNPTQPNICVMENVSFTSDEINQYMDFVGNDLFTQDFWSTVHQFKNAKHFGSLIRPKMTDAATMRNRLEETGALNDLFLQSTNERMQKLLEMVDYLGSHYHVVVANPPYMGSRQMNSTLKSFAKDEYEDSKSDLFAMFIERGLDLAKRHGYTSMITMQSWMFLSSYESLRELLLRDFTILSMAHLGANAFDAISGEVVQTTAFVLQNAHAEACQGEFLRLIEGNSEAEKQQDFASNKHSPHLAAAADFKKIPGSPIAYWVSDSSREVFALETNLGSKVTARQGLATGDNERFLRYFWEVTLKDIGLYLQSAEQGRKLGKKWFPINKGGSFRKWYGNAEYVIIFDQTNREILKSQGNHLPSEHLYFESSVSWSDVTSAINSFRYFPKGYLFDATGHSAFPEDSETRNILLCYTNNKFVNRMVQILNPTMHFHVGYFNLLPYPSKLFTESRKDFFDYAFDELVDLARSDWDSYETSWDFTDLPLLRTEHRRTTLADTYTNLCAGWRKMTQKMQRLEEENNRIFIEAYGLQDELNPEVPLTEITLTGNPHYRYGDKYTEEELEAKLLEDTMQEFISYAVGCMFGRYALEKEGLILANQGETRADYDRKVPNAAFPADKDNAIPILPEPWFEDDIVERFKQFLRITFGTEHYEQNLAFIEEAIGKPIREYFLRSYSDYHISDFYKDHLSRYSKRPIYWLFSSPKLSFNVLVYMHRYQPDTVSIVLNQYLREYRNKLEARVAYLEGQSTSEAVSAADRTQALKDLERYKSIIKELNDYERDTLYPLATEQREIDLDDGVKVNYSSFGDALYEVPGLNK